MFHDIPGCSMMFRGVPEFSRMFQGCSGMFQCIPGYSTDVPECSGMFCDVLECPMMFSAVQGVFNQIQYVLRAIPQIPY